PATASDNSASAPAAAPETASATPVPAEPATTSPAAVEPAPAVAPPSAEPAGEPKPAPVTSADTQTAATSAATPAETPSSAATATGAAPVPAPAVAPAAPVTEPAVSPQQTPGSPSTGGPAAASPEATTAFGSQGTDVRIVLRAVRDSWIQIREANGELVNAQLLRPGERYNVPNRPGLVLLTGNAGGLELVVDGKTAPPLGPQGSIRRNVALDPAKLLAGTTTTD
ncbi:MAG: DUF4115 domain-containing protein, partial [Rhodospirillales bacterium]